MANPDIDVVTGRLRAEAHMWEKQAQSLSSVHHTVEGLRLTRIEAGLFQVIFNAYKGAINEVSQRTREGQARMDDIAEALRKNARAYDEGEDEVTHSIDGAY